MEGGGEQDRIPGRLAGLDGAGRDDRPGAGGFEAEPRAVSQSRTRYAAQSRSGWHARTGRCRTEPSGTAARGEAGVLLRTAGRWRARPGARAAQGRTALRRSGGPVAQCLSAPARPDIPAPHRAAGRWRVRPGRCRSGTEAKAGWLALRRRRAPVAAARTPVRVLRRAPQAPGRRHRRSTRTPPRPGQIPARRLGSRDESAQQRRIQPWGYAAWRGRWYVVGWDLDRGAQRCLPESAGAIGRTAVVTGSRLPVGAAVSRAAVPTMAA
jgi:hypothetical protein